MESISVDYSHSLIKHEELKNIKPHTLISNKILNNKLGAGNDYLGWLHYPHSMSDQDIQNIVETSNQIKDICDILIVIGIGGSYLSSNSIISPLKPSFEKNKDHPTIIYAGYNLSSNYLEELLAFIDTYDICINVISKSGTTFETAITFRILHSYMKAKYKKDYNKRIFVTTDYESPLHKMSKSSNFKSFIIPTDIGGRFSTFTPAGLLPAAVSDIDIRQLISGARFMQLNLLDESFSSNISLQYAALRHTLYQKGYAIELFASYEPKIHPLLQWLRQLFAESEGKNFKGLFPSIANFSADLHSVGQFIQEGKQNLFETVLNIEKPNNNIKLTHLENNYDNLNNLENTPIDTLNKYIYKSTQKAHVDGGIPNIVINIPKLNEYHLGQLIYFFQKSCAISAYMLSVNPFNQPGVEKYKANLREILKEHK